MNWLILSIIIIISILIAIGFLSLYVLIFSLIIDTYKEQNNGKN